MYFSRKLRQNLAFEYFISKKTLKSVVQGKKVSKPIVQISIISIALAVIVNLVTIAVVAGFQQEVRQKISGFGSHIFIQRAGEGSIYESEPIRKEQAVFKKISQLANTKSISPVAYKPVLFQSKLNQVTYQLSSGKDTTEFQQDILGAILKGVDENYDWNFFKEHMVQGSIPEFTNGKNEDHIVISTKLADDLQFKLNDTVAAFFVKNSPIKKQFIVHGIYSTGLEEFDEKIVIGNLHTTQKLNDWGIQASIEIADTLADGQLIIKADVSGGNGNYRYDWGNGYANYSGFTDCPQKDTLIRVIVSDYWSDINGQNEITSIADTAYLNIKVSRPNSNKCDYQLNELDEIDRVYLDNTGHNYFIKSGPDTLTFKSSEGKGSSHNYVGGFEILLNDWNKLDASFNAIKRQVDFIPNEFNEVLKTSTIKDNQREIFVWLGFLDINVIIILSLMILIGIINMGSALLVLILIRSNFIGLMKAMGATNWSIRKIFLIQAAFLIGKGMIWGNLIGLGICFGQQYFGWFTLNPEVYYLSKVPIQLNVTHWIILNITTLFICVISLILPSIVITRISPVKSIKFN